MKNKLFPLLSVFFGLLVFSGPLSAHHGKGAFDMENLTIVKGTVTRFEFINPHALIYKNSLKPGVQVIVTGHRAKNGAYGMELQCKECSVADSQGKVLLGYYF